MITFSILRAVSSFPVTTARLTFSSLVTKVVEQGFASTVLQKRAIGCGFVKSFNKYPVFEAKNLILGFHRLDEKLCKNISFLHNLKGQGPQSIRWMTTQTGSVTGKKRTKRKAGTMQPVLEDADNEVVQSTYPVVAYATCDEMDLEKLRKGLIFQRLYIPTIWTEESDSALHDVIHVSAKYPISDEPREIFFFREGTVVFWNVPDLERYNVLSFLKEFEIESYTSSEVMQESEFMLYSHGENEQQRTTKLSRGKIYLNPNPGADRLILDKYTVANAMALSVKLGIWESTLDKFVDSIDHITEELKGARKLKLTRAQVLQKTGELFSLRNELNLNSDLLDTPDFYWEHEHLENLYHKMYNYLSISRRTGVMNEKLSQCCELLELISGHLNDKHHVRLEWMIIALISVEAAMCVVNYYS